MIVSALSSAGQWIKHLLDIITASSLFIRFGFHIQPFFKLKQFCIHPDWAILFTVFGLHLQIHQKIKP